MEHSETNLQTTKEPEISHEPAEIIPPKSKLWLTPVLFVIASLLIIITTLFIYQNYQARRQLAKSISPSQPQETGIPFPSPLLDEPIKTYTDEMYQFQLEYPESWQITKSQNKEMATIQFSNQNSDGRGATIMVTVIQNPSELLSDDISGMEYGNLKKAPFNKLPGYALGACFKGTPNEISFAGLPAYTTGNCNLDANVRHTDVAIVWNGKIYHIQESLDHAINYYQVTEKIMSSFRFLQLPLMQTIINPNQRQTYVDKTNQNFSFTYPKNMPTPTSFFDYTQPRFDSDYYYPDVHIEHCCGVAIYIEGPYPNTETQTITDFLKQNNWPYEGEAEGYGVISKTGEIMLDHQKAMLTVSYERGSTNPRGWFLYFQTAQGIYRIELNLNVKPEDMAYYSQIFTGIQNSFKFLK